MLGFGTVVAWMRVGLSIVGAAKTMIWVNVTRAAGSYVHVSAGQYSSCAVSSAGSVECWGCESGEIPVNVMRHRELFDDVSSAGCMPVVSRPAGWPSVGGVRTMILVSVIRRRAHIRIH